MDYLQRGLKPVWHQLYFKNLYLPGGMLARRASEESLAQYKRWGFLGREAPTVDVYRKSTVGRPDRDPRHNILRRLFQEKRSLSVGEHLQALGGVIIRQQALQDLKTLARMSGKGRGAKWTLRRSGVQ